MTTVPILRLPPLPSIRDIVRMYKLQAQHQLSQNFLLDTKICNKIVRAAGNLQEGHVCEVGPGPGGLTRSILNSGVRQCTVIEKDKRFLPGLELLNEASLNRMIIINGDILHQDLYDIFPQEIAESWLGPRPNIHLIGNLPFNISTQLVIKWLEMVASHSGAFSLGRIKMTLTFQKEVAERIVAPAGNHQRSRLSIMCQHLCEADLKFIISGSSFLPKPEVDAGVITLVPRKQPLIEAPFKTVEKLVSSVFHYRQKYCKFGIKRLFPEEMPELTEELFVKSDVDPKCRTYNLTILEFGKMCNAYEDICEQIPGIRHFNYRLKKKK